MYSVIRSGLCSRSVFLKRFPSTSTPISERCGKATTPVDTKTRGAGPPPQDLENINVRLDVMPQTATIQGATMKIIAASAAVGGVTTALAISHDVMRLLTLHTATAHTAFAALHSLHRCEE